jgi:hypothetical protein
MFMTAWVFEARHCPTLLNGIKKTKLQIYTSPQAGINILLAVVRLDVLSVKFSYSPSSMSNVWFVLWVTVDSEM